MVIEGKCLTLEEGATVHAEYPKATAYERACFYLMKDGYICTRPKHTDGPHVAHITVALIVEPDK